MGSVVSLLAFWIGGAAAPPFVAEPTVQYYADVADLLDYVATVTD